MLAPNQSIYFNFIKEWILFYLYFFDRIDMIVRILFQALLVIMKIGWLNHKIWRFLCQLYKHASPQCLACAKADSPNCGQQYFDWCWLAIRHLLCQRWLIPGAFLYRAYWNDLVPESCIRKPPTRSKIQVLNRDVNLMMKGFIFNGKNTINY